MNLQDDENIIHYATIATVLKPQKLKCKTENLNKDINLYPLNKLNTANEGIKNNIIADTLVVNNQNTPINNSCWRKWTGKQLLHAVAAGVSVCLIVLTAAAIVWTRTNDISQISNISQNGSDHGDHQNVSNHQNVSYHQNVSNHQNDSNHTQYGNSQTSIISQKGRNRTHGKISKSIIFLYYIVYITKIII